jgi:hypothetical protein
MARAVQRPEKYRFDMRALDQFRKFVATIAGGSARSQQWPDLNHEQSDRRTLAPDDQRATRTTQATRDDDKRARPPSGSYPAVWPR